MRHTHNPLVGVVPAAVGRGQRGRALLCVPGGQALLGGAADGDGVDAVRVAVAVAVVPLAAAVARRPDKDGAFSTTTLWRTRRGRDTLSGEDHIERAGPHWLLLSCFRLLKSGNAAPKLGLFPFLTH